MKTEPQMETVITTIATTNAQTSLLRLSDSSANRVSITANRVSTAANCSHPPGGCCAIRNSVMIESGGKWLTGITVSSKPFRDNRIRLTATNAHFE